MASLGSAAESSFEPGWPGSDTLTVLGDGQLRRGHRLALISSSAQFDRDPPSLGRAPRFGEHTDVVLAELGLGGDQILKAKFAGAVV